MKTKTITTLGIILLSLTLISSMYAGNTYYFDLTDKVPIIENLTYQIVDNSSDLNGLYISYNSTGLILNSEPNYKLDDFTIKINISGKQITEIPIYSGSSSSCSYNENYDWKCSEWSECINGTQTRTCKIRNNCGSTYGMPNLIQNCIVEENNETECEDYCYYEPIDLTDWENNGLNWNGLLKFVGVILFLVLIVWLIKKRGKNEER